MVSENFNWLVLNIRRCVCGVSSSTVKVVFQEGVSSVDPKIEHGPKVAMVDAV